MIVNISPRKIAKLLISIILVLTVIHCLLQFIDDGMDFNQIHAFRRFFDFELDSNVPTWYSSITLFVSSLLLGLIAIVKKQAKDNFALHWKLLAIIFTCLSIDEVAMFHEQFGNVLKTLFSVEFDGWLHYSWVVVAIPIVLVIFIAYLRLIMHLPATIRKLFLLAGALYVGGAIGLEILAGHQKNLDVTTSSTILYELFTTIEELWEKLGVMVFIYALLSYVKKYLKLTQITIGNGSLSSNQVGLSKLQGHQYSSK